MEINLSALLRNPALQALGCSTVGRQKKKRTVVEKKINDKRPTPENNWQRTEMNANFKGRIIAKLLNEKLYETSGKQEEKKENAKWGPRA